MLAFTQAHSRSLAHSVSGDLVQVEHILFEGLRARCADLGINEGDRLHCRSVSQNALVLETPTGRMVAIEREWAQFIQVGAQRT
jgi:hypothetical protein